MRWFLRRLVFYVFAIWVALTITFLLPRLMPGDPIGGILQHLSPAQIAVEPGDHQDLPGAARRRRPVDLAGVRQYLHRVATLNFGISTSNYPTKVSEVVATRCRTRSSSSGSRSRSRSCSARRSAWSRRGGGAASFDTVFVPVFMALGAFPAYFTGLLVVYFLGLKLGWFPIQHAYDNGDTPGFNWPFISSAVPPRHPPVARHRHRVRGRLGAEHAHGDDQHDLRGLRRDGSREGPSRHEGDDALRGTERDPAAAERLRRRSSQRAVGGVIFIELVFSYPGAGYTLQQAVLGNDYPLTQALLLVLPLCPIVANLIMDILNLILDPASGRVADVADDTDRSSCRPRCRSPRRGGSSRSGLARC